MVDRSAPVVVDTQADIAATPAAAWAALTDVDRWTDWNPVIDEARLDGPLAVGSVIRWRTSGLTLASTLVTVEAEHAIGLDGTDQGIRGLHDWRIEPVDGRARVVVSESMSGGAASQNSAKMQAELRTMLDTWLANLKARAERAPAPGAPDASG